MKRSYLLLTNMLTNGYNKGSYVFLLTDSILKIKNYGDLMLLDSEIQKYLKMNHIKVYIEKDYEFLDLSIIDDDLKGKEIFLTGENHGVKANENYE